MQLQQSEVVHALLFLLAMLLVLTADPGDMDDGVGASPVTQAQERFVSAR